MSYKKSNTVRTNPGHAVPENCGIRNFRIGTGSIVLTLLASSCTLERHEYTDDTAPLSSGDTTASALPSATALATVKPKPTQNADDDAGAPDTTSPGASSPPPGDDGGAPPIATDDSDSGAPPAATSAAPAEEDGGVPPAGDDVHGKVIDYYGRPLSDIQVRIGEETTTTNDDGEFTIADVPATYTLDFRVDRNGVTGDVYAWRYIGLTRRDPTVQSFQSSLPQRNTHIVVTTDLPSTSEDEIAVSFGSSQGSQRKSLSYNGVDTTIGWSGPTSLAAKGHALVKHLTDDLPTGYGAYVEQDFSFADAADLDWELEVDGADDLVPKNVSGSVTVETEEYRTNYGFLTFTSNGVLNLFDVHTDSAAFTYLVPSIPSASILLLADNTGTYDYSGAYAYRQGLAAGETDVDLAIPAPPTIISPLAGDTVDDSTEFSWDTDSAVSIVQIEDSDYYRGVFIVTSKTTLTSGEFLVQPLRAGAGHFWEVQTHGNCASVDACAGPNGALDPMYYYDSGNLGPVKHDGSAAWTSRFGFTTAP